jgi:hypothetical protein
MRQTIVQIERSGKDKAEYAVEVRHESAMASRSADLRSSFVPATTISDVGPQPRDRAVASVVRRRLVRHVSRAELVSDGPFERRETLAQDSRFRDGARRTHVVQVGDELVLVGDFLFEP